MKKYNKNNESSYIMYLLGWAMSQKWPMLISKFDKNVIKIYDKNSDIGYTLKADVKYLKNLYNSHNDLSFLQEKMKIKEIHKLICNLYDKNNYVKHIRTLKQALNHVVILKGA